MPQKRFIKNKRRANKRPRVSFAQKVQRVINRSQETKKSIYESGLVSYNSPITATGDVLRIMPDIPRGTSSWERTGQKITLTKIVIRGYITTTGPATTSDHRARYGIRHLLLADKQKNDWQQVTGTDLNGLLEAVSAPGQAFSGTTANYMTPINRENFTSRMDKKFPLTQNYAPASDGSASARDCIKFFTKTLTFGTNGKDLYFEGSNHPINFKYFMSLGYCYLDNSAPDSVTTDVMMNYTATAYYKDG